jgi:hypothetical protein
LLALSQQINEVEDIDETLEVSKRKLDQVEKAAELL